MTTRPTPRAGGSRQRVLSALRETTPQPVPLPDLRYASAELTMPSRIEAFANALAEAGAGFGRIANEAELEATLRGYAPYAAAERVVSGVAGIGVRGEGTELGGSPHSFSDVDVTVARGSFGVAENGAVWCDGEGLPHRATYFLCQHLVLVVEAATLVETMHAAYERLGAQRAQEAGRREAPWCGFIAGPSKTADIEQALVVGAHGPRSHFVVLVG